MDRYVLLGLAPARAEWFRAVAHWCTAASIPAEFVKCVSVEQVRASLAGGRPYSAVLVDSGTPGLDLDLIELAGRVGVPVVVVGDGHAGRAAGATAAAALPRAFGPDQLLDALSSVAARIDDVVAVTDEVLAPVTRPSSGRVVAVCGPGGTGASTIAIALAQSMPGSVLLADLRLHAEQAMLHDAHDVVPGVQELVEAFRSRRDVDPRSLTFDIPERGYDLLLGLRQSRLWPALRPRSFEAAFDALRSHWTTVVCDTDADVEGERECGSVDVEDRNVMARTVMAQADAVFVVGVPGMKGVYSMVRVVNELVGFGVGAARIVPVVNRAPRSPRARAEVSRSLSGLVATPLASPVFVPERRVDQFLRDGVRLPPVVTAPLASASAAILSTVSPPRVGRREPELIAPGSLGSWSGQ